MIRAPAGQRVAVIDYGIGNVQSVLHACRRAGQTAERLSDGVALAAYAPDRVILPGVGAVGAALQRLQDRGLLETLQALVIGRGLPFLGICVGMQILADRCEEFGDHAGLGWIPGAVTLIDGHRHGLKVPHVGWNAIDPADPADPALGPLAGKDLYFAHSYAFRCRDDRDVAARTRYGDRFASAVRRGNITGVQFHPEKSGAAGAHLLAAFFETPSC